jgi:hypothetical protein
MARDAHVIAPPLTLEEQLRAAYALVDELHDMEVRLRAVVDSALS